MYAKKYNATSQTWQPTGKLWTTKSSDLILPATIYCDGSNITTYTIKGNTVQDGTPTPSSPVEVECFGDLIASGDNAGKYDIPITSGGVTNHIILSEPLRKIVDYADTIDSEGVVTRRIGKIVLTGEESWKLSGGNLFSNVIDNTAASSKAVLSTHFVSTSSRGLFVSVGGNRLKLFANSFPTGVTGSTSMKTWLATQYTNGTPVTIWYVLVTPETSSQAGVSIPTVAGDNTISVDTTVQPSEFTATWTGWHELVGKVFDGTDWI